MSHIVKTVRYALIYTVGALLERSVSFIMLPIYTRYLTPGDYGTLELLTMTLDIVAMIAGLGISEAVFRFYYKTEDLEHRKELISTVVVLLIISYLAASVTGYVYSDKVASLVLGDVENNLIYTHLIFGCLFLQSLIVVPLVFIRAQQKPILFVAITTAKLLLQLSLNIYFVVGLRMHVLGVLYSTVITSLVIGIFLIVYTFKTTGLRFSINMSAAIIRFGAPLTVSSLASFILTFSDRYFLKEYSTVDEVGIYSLGYKLGFVLWVFAVRPIFNIWDPKRFEIARTPDAQDINRQMFILFNIILVSFGLAIAIFSKNLFHIMSAEAFWSAYKIVPLIILAYTIQGWTAFVNFGAMFNAKTKYIAYGNLIAAGSIIIFSFILIPRYSSFGAAAATILAFIVRFVIVYRYSQRCYKLILDWSKILSLLALACLVYLASTWLDYSSVSLSILKNIMLMLSYFGALLFMPILRANEKREILSALQHPIASAKIILFNS